ncbi:tetratricopeptide repeat protein [uncultured Maribacter sp.]|uniref:tetratricopeptide repeat protein n=1 Tax=uncultured Maribacter sp. TaxID=431308 RepID=UPI002628B03C|nr:tetratricopeptide repeat protein [uncultured Maribacter sp.]
MWLLIFTIIPGITTYYSFFSNDAGKAYEQSVENGVKIDALVEEILSRNKLDNTAKKFTKEQLDIFAKSLTEFSNSKLNTGIAELYLLDYSKALKSFSEAISLDKKNGKAYFYRGLTLYQENFNPRVNSEIYYDYTKKVNLNSLNKMIKDFGESIITIPTLIDAYFYRGTLYEYQGKYKEALIDLNFAINNSPNDSYYLNNRGVIYSNLGHSNNDQLSLMKALSDFSKAINLKPRKSLYYFNKGLVYTRLGDYREDLKFYSRAIELNPVYTRAYFNRGATFKLLKKYDLAIAEFDTVISIDKDYEIAYLVKGECFFETGKFQDACETWKFLAKINPNYKTVYRNIGDSMFALKKFQEAIKFYEMELARNPDDIYAKTKLKNTSNYLKNNGN